MRKAIAVLLLIAGAILTFSFTGSAESENNIALGKSYVVTSTAASDRSYQKLEDSNMTILTDGKNGNNGSYYGGTWQHFYRGVNRSITVDLGSVMSVTGFRVGFLQYAPDGVFAPKYFTCEMSVDGESFSHVSTVDPPFATNYSVSRVRAKYTDEFDALAARYVRITFNVSVNLFIDEIEIYGGELTGSENALGEPLPAEDEQYFFPRESLGVYDTVCFHYGYYPANGKVANNAVGSFLPYIAYLDEVGEIRDTMFDSVMFLIVGGYGAPSGTNYTVASDWQYLLDNTFGDGINLNALEADAQTLKDSLSLDGDFKIGVYLAPPYPGEYAAFGDYNGDGVNDTVSTTDEKLALFEWYIDTVISRFGEQNYKNIELKGFFWPSESIIGNVAGDDLEFAKRGIRLIQSKNKQVYFVPYYQGDGIGRYEEFPFDGVAMQPNLNFDSGLIDDPEGAMADFVYNAKQFHTGIQVEIHHDYFEDSARWGDMFMEYLDAAVNGGLMTDSIHCYYQGAGPGVFYNLAYSSAAQDRYLYDCLYGFIKGTLNMPEEKSVTTAQSLEIKDSSVSGSLTYNGDWFESMMSAKPVVSVTVKPAHGSVVFTDSRNYKYAPDESFTGSDSFVIKVVSGDFSAELTVNIVKEEEVSEPASSEAASEPASSDAASSDAASSEASSGGNGSGGSRYLIPGIITAVVVVFGAVALIVIKRKKID